MVVSVSQKGEAGEVGRGAVSHEPSKLAEQGTGSPLELWEEPARRPPLISGL